MIPIVLLSVQAKESQSALYKILDDRVVNPLARIPGVGTVSISGAPPVSYTHLCVLVKRSLCFTRTEPPFYKNRACISSKTKGDFFFRHDQT